MTTTADDLLAKMKLRCHWPGSSVLSPIPTADLLSLADDEIVGWLYPMMLAAQGDYHTTYKDYSITANQSRYRLPRKMFGPVKKVLIVESDGTEHSVNFCNLGEIGELGGGTDPSDSGFTAFIDGDFVGLYPTPSRTEKTLRIRYYHTPNTLSLLTNARQIDALTSATRLTLDNDHSFTMGTQLDIISASPAHQVIADALVVTAAGSATVDFASYPSSVAVDDYVIATGFTPIVQAPDELVPLLIHRVAMQALNAVGDAAGFERVAALSAGFEVKGKGAIEPRSESEPRTVISRGSPHRIGLGRGG